MGAILLSAAILLECLDQCSGAFTRGVCATCSACTPRRTKAKYRRLWCTIEDTAFENGPELSMKPEPQSSRKSMRETHFFAK